MASTVATARTIEIRGGTIEKDGHKVAIQSDPILVGRAASCQLTIDDPRVSSVHCELLATPNGVRIRDLGSKNGTWAGDVRIIEGMLDEAVTLMVGPVEIAFAPARPEEVKLTTRERLQGLYGRTPAMRDVFSRVERAGPTEVTVLIEGETGTGKELVAHAIHALSRRKNEPFVIVDCGSIPSGLAESLLFGHVRGAFTGAVREKVSPFVEAKGGTVFLDELGELPIETQPKLLRALAEKRIQPVGGDAYVPFNARVVAATRRDLQRAINDGSFRSDLYFRVAQLRIEMPALRDRADDIPGLIKTMLDHSDQAAAYRRITRESMTRLVRHDWPGNVRELANAVAVGVALADPKGPIDIAVQLGVEGAAGDTMIGLGTLDLGYHEAKRAALDRFEKAYFSAMLERTGGNIAEMSRRAGLQRTHVRKYLVSHGLKKR